MLLLGGHNVAVLLQNTPIRGKNHLTVVGFADSNSLRLCCARFERDVVDLVPSISVIGKCVVEAHVVLWNFNQEVSFQRRAIASAELMNFHAPCLRRKGI